MPSHKGFTAWITCDGVRLDEFEPRLDADGIKSTAWIISEAGKTLSVHWRDEGSQVPTAGYIVLDGCTVPGRFLWGSGETFRAGVRSGPCTERPFTFAQMSSTTGASATGKPSPQDVGTIVLKIKKVQRGDPRISNKYQVLPPPLTAEWGPATGGHCATFGTEVVHYDQYPQTWSAPPWDTSSPGSFVKFVFRYRPLEFLQMQGIAPSNYKRPVKNADGSSSAPPPLPPPISRSTSNAMSNAPSPAPGGSLRNVSTSSVASASTPHPRPSTITTYTTSAGADGCLPFVHVNINTTEPPSADSGMQEESTSASGSRNVKRSASGRRASRGGIGKRTVSGSSAGGRTVSGSSMRRVSSRSFKEDDSKSVASEGLFSQFVNFGEDDMDFD